MICNTLRNYACVASLIVSSALTSSSFAHGPQIQITAESGKIQTREIFYDEEYTDYLADPKQVYVIPVQEYLGVWYSRPNGTPDPLDPSLPQFYSGPGFAYGYDRTLGGSQVFASGSQFGIGFTTGLTKWDGASFVDAGAAQLEAFQGANTARTVDNATSPAIAFPAAGVPANYGSGSHGTVRYRFLGDGLSTAVAPGDGIYLASLQLSNSTQGIQASDPFLFVLHKNASIADVTSAVGSLGIDANLIQFVPEPCGLGLVSLLSLLGWHRMRKSM